MFVVYKDNFLFPAANKTKQKWSILIAKSAKSK